MTVPAWRRLGAVVVLALVAVALVRADADRRDEPVEVVGSFGTPDVGFPVAAPATALSSTWYCPGGPAPAAGQGASIIVLNTGADDVTGTLTVFPATAAGRGAPVEAPLEVPAGERRVVTLADVAVGEWAAALVEVLAGEVAVEQTFVDDVGFTVAPCSSSASDRWWFAEGDTTRTEALSLVLFNPFADDAVLDATFETASGVREPPALQGLVVPARSVRRIDLGEPLPRLARIAMTMSARTGRVVAARLQRSSGEFRPAGSSLALAVPAPQIEWFFPDAASDGSRTTAYAVFNPGAREVEVTVEVRMDDPTVIVEPFSLQVTPRTVQVLDLGDTAGRVPPGAAAVRVYSAGDPVVVDQIATFSAAAGADRAGLSLLAGAPVIADRWAFTKDAATGTVGDALSIVNPGADPVQVRVLALLPGGSRLAVPLPGAAGGPPVDSLRLDGGATLRVPLGAGSVAAGFPVVVVGDGPLVAARGQGLAGRPGASQAFGVPLP